MERGERKQMTLMGGVMLVVLVLMEGGLVGAGNHVETVVVPMLSRPSRPCGQSCMSEPYACQRRPADWHEGFASFILPPAKEMELVSLTITAMGQSGCGCDQHGIPVQVVQVFSLNGVDVGTFSNDAQECNCYCTQGCDMMAPTTTLVEEALLTVNFGDENIIRMNHTMGRGCYTGYKVDAAYEEVGQDSGARCCVFINPVADHEKYSCIPQTAVCPENPGGFYQLDRSFEVETCDDCRPEPVEGKKPFTCCTYQDDDHANKVFKSLCLPSSDNGCPELDHHFAASQRGVDDCTECHSSSTCCLYEDEDDFTTSEVCIPPGEKCPLFDGLVKLADFAISDCGRCELNRRDVSGVSTEWNADRNRMDDVQIDGNAWA
mmetsp:Transcript_6772/g.19173  ORF Transcript_6772/g.19173 Transcript_6772/m.19173 type:complete len:376 (+) Transcript_6772:57-1184(+)